MKQAIEQGQPISVLERVVGRESIIAQVEYELININALLNMNLSLNEMQIPIIAKTLVETFYNESIQDFQLCFRKGVTGRYGTVYNLDIAVLSRWMGQYLDEKYQFIEMQKSSDDDDSDHYVDYKAFLIRLEHERAKQKELADNKLKAERDRQLKELQFEEIKRNYRPPGPEAIARHELHIQYLRENYHPITQEKLPGWMSEEDWMKKK